MSDGGGEQKQVAHVRVFTTTFCGYCMRAKMLLSRRGIAYEEVNVSNDAEKRAWLVQATRQRTVPQIFIGEESIGGFDELAALDRAGALVPRVFGA
jgi:glutaredoxin 3